MPKKRIVNVIEEIKKIPPRFNVKWGYCPNVGNFISNPPPSIGTIIPKILPAKRLKTVKTTKTKNYPN